MKTARAVRPRGEVFPAEAGHAYLIMRGPGGEAIFRRSGNPHELDRYTVASGTNVRISVPKGVRKYFRNKFHPVIDLPEEFGAMLKLEQSGELSLVADNGVIIDDLKSLAGRGVTLRVVAPLALIPAHA